MSSSDSDSSSSSSAAPINKTVQKVKKTVVSDSDSSSSSSSSSEVAQKVTKKVVKKAESSSDDSSSSSSSEAVKKVTKKVVKKAESSSDDSSSSSSSEAVKKVTKKVTKADSSSDDSSSSSEEEKPKKVTKKDESSSDDSSSSSSSSDEKPALKRKRDDSDVNGEEDTTIFVGGFPYDKTEQDIRDLLAECGEIESVRMPTFPDSGRSRGIAFVTFTEAEACTKAMKFHEQDFGGRYIFIKKSDGRAPSSGEKKAFKPYEPIEKPDGCKTIFIGGLSFSATQEDLRATFEGCGSIVDARIAWDYDNDRSKGFGYVDFEDSSATDSAVKLSGTSIAGRPCRVDFSAPREPRPDRGFGGRDGGRDGGRGGRGGRGGFGGGRGGRGGFGGNSGGFNKNKGSMVAGQNKKMTF